VPKLSEPQKRVLRALVESTRIMVDSYGHRWARWPWWMGGHARKDLRLNIRTLRALETGGLLEREPADRQTNFNYILTDLGRKVAEELEKQDAEA